MMRALNLTLAGLLSACGVCENKALVASTSPSVLRAGEKTTVEFVAPQDMIPTKLDPADRDSITIDLWPLGFAGPHYGWSGANDSVFTNVSRVEGTTLRIDLALPPDTPAGDYRIDVGKGASDCGGGRTIATADVTVTAP